jgi:hypothetical protein
LADPHFRLTPDDDLLHASAGYQKRKSTRFVTKNDVGTENGWALKVIL